MLFQSIIKLFSIEKKFIDTQYIIYNNVYIWHLEKNFVKKR